MSYISVMFSQQIYFANFEISTCFFRVCTCVHAFLCEFVSVCVCVGVCVHVGMCKYTYLVFFCAMCALCFSLRRCMCERFICMYMNTLGRIAERRQHEHLALCVQHINGSKAPRGAPQNPCALSSPLLRDMNLLYLRGFFLASQS